MKIDFFIFQYDICGRLSDLGDSFLATDTEKWLTTINNNIEDLRREQFKNDISSKLFKNLINFE